jgi:hypothetical protein
MRKATKVALHVARVVLVGLFWFSPFLALGFSFGASPAESSTAPVAIVLGLGFLCLVSAWMVDWKLRPHVHFWRKQRAAKIGK